jgi:hypothetical protein
MLLPQIDPLGLLQSCGQVLGSSSSQYPFPQTGGQSSSFNELQLAGQQPSVLQSSTGFALQYDLGVPSYLQ